MSTSENRARAGFLWVLLPQVILLAIILFWQQNPGTHNRLLFWLNGLQDITGADFWALVTILSNGLVSFVLVLPFIRKQPERIFAVAIAAILFTIIDHSIKNSGSYPRPMRLLPELLRHIGPRLHQNSFPSGHASMIIALAGVWVFTTRSIGMRWLLLVPAVVIGFSRAVVTAHWPIDVSVGLMTGWLSAYIAVVVTPLIRWSFHPRMHYYLSAAYVLTGIVATIYSVKGFEIHITWIVRGFCLLMTLLGIREFLLLHRSMNARKEIA